MGSFTARLRGHRRNYHSTALLMPDGRVFTGGGNINSQQDGENVRPLELDSMNRGTCAPTGRGS